MAIKIKKHLTAYNLEKRTSRTIKYIVIHYFGDLGTAENVAKYFANAYRGASAHYSVDESPIVYQSVEDKDVAWHCGTSGKYFHNECRNSNSIGIEIRPHKLNRNSLLATDNDWYFLNETVNNALELTKMLMEKYDIPPENVLRHYDVTRKLCPRPFVGSEVNRYYKRPGKDMWEDFKAKLIQSEDENMDGKEIFDKLSEYLASLPVSEFAQSASKKGVASGIFADGDKDGHIDKPRSMLTREQLAVILDRAGIFDK